MNVFAVGLDKDGRVIAVFWGRVNTHTNEWASAEVIAPVSEVVKAIHAGDQVFALFASTNGHLPDRPFMVVEYKSGWETIALKWPATHEREIHDMERLDPHDIRRRHHLTKTRAQ